MAWLFSTPPVSYTHLDVYKRQGEHLEYALQQNGWNGRFIHCAVRNACLPHASVAQIKQATGLDAAHLVQAVQMAVTKGENLL